MKHYVVYDEITGEIEISGTCQDVDFDLQRRPNKGLIEGPANYLTHYVKDESLVAYTPEQAMEKSNPQPPFMSWSNDVMEWRDSRSWQEINQTEAAIARNQRNAMLTDSDWTDTLSAKGRLGDALYQAWQDYRQALRDITGQPGFPLNVTWPQAPQ